MTEELEKLKREYRGIEAPTNLSARVRAELTAQPRRRPGWIPMAATALVAVGVAWVFPFLWQAQTQITPPVSKPSLASLASMTPSKPSVGTPNLSQLKSLTVLKTPVKPPAKKLKPQSNFNEQSELLEESKNAYI